jgi:hypothetical protein
MGWAPDNDMWALEPTGSHTDKGERFSRLLTWPSKVIGGLKRSGGKHEASARRKCLFRHFNTYWRNFINLKNQVQSGTSLKNKKITPIYARGCLYFVPIPYLYR